MISVRVPNAINWASEAQVMALYADWMSIKCDRLDRTKKSPTNPHKPTTRPNNRTSSLNNDHGCGDKNALRGNVNNANPFIIQSLNTNQQDKYRSPVISYFIQTFENHQQFQSAMSKLPLDCLILQAYLVDEWIMLLACVSYQAHFEAVWVCSVE